MSFDDNLCLSRSFQRNRQCRHNFQTSSHKAADHRILVDVNRALPDSTEREERMRADDDQNGSGFAFSLVALDIVPEMTATVEACAEASRSLDLHPMEARIAHASIGVLGDNHCIRDVATSVLCKMQHDWQLAQIGRL